MTTKTRSGVPTDLHPFLAIKYEHMFHLLYDTKKNGNISRHNFSQLLKRLAAIQGLEPQTKEYKTLEEKVNSVWSKLIRGSRFYRHHSSQLHLNVIEWLSYWRDFARAARETTSWPETSIDGSVDYTWKRDIVNLIFEIMDKNGCGTINRDDYVRVMSGLGLEQEVSEQAFDVISQNNNHNVKREQFADLWLDYLTNEKPGSHPGNSILGILDQEIENQN